MVATDLELRYSNAKSNSLPITLNILHSQAHQKLKLSSDPHIGRARSGIELHTVGGHHHCDVVRECPPSP